MTKEVNQKEMEILALEIFTQDYLEEMENPVNNGHYYFKIKKPYEVLDGYGNLIKLTTEFRFSFSYDGWRYKGVKSTHWAYFGRKSDPEGTYSSSLCIVDIKGIELLGTKEQVAAQIVNRFVEINRNSYYHPRKKAAPNVWKGYWTQYKGVEVITKNTK